MRIWPLLASALLILTIAVRAEDDNALHLVGSTTVSDLVAATADSFRRKTGITLIIRPIGSSKGLLAVAEDVADIGMISRYMDAEEQSKWPHLRQVTVGQDVLAVIINRSNPIENLSLNQLGQIYAGKILSWNQLGDSPATAENRAANIDLYSKAKGHGTFDSFTTLVGLDAMYEPQERKLYFKLKGVNQLFSRVGATVFDRANQAVATVQRLPQAIAYDSLGALSQLERARHATQVKIIQINGVHASVGNAANGSYPLVRPVNLLFNRETTDARVHLYLDFLLSKEGQQLVEAHAFVPIR